MLRSRTQNQGYPDTGTLSGKRSAHPVGFYGENPLAPNIYAVPQSRQMGNACIDTGLQKPKSQQLCGYDGRQHVFAHSFLGRVKARKKHPASAKTRHKFWCWKPRNYGAFTGQIFFQTSFDKLGAPQIHARGKVC